MDFSEIKLCSKLGAFIHEDDDGQSWVQTSTQNSRLQCEVDEQALPLPQHLKALVEEVFSAYPSYVNIIALIKKHDVNRTEAMALINEMAKL